MRPTFLIREPTDNSLASWNAYRQVLVKMGREGHDVSLHFESADWHFAYLEKELTEETRLQSIST